MVSAGRSAELGTFSLGWAGLGAAAAPLPSTVVTVGRDVYRVCTLNGHTLSNVFSARCSFGFDQRIAEAVIELAEDPVDSLGTYYDAVTVALGAGSNNVVRFRGILVERQYTLYPRAVRLICKGNLWRAAQYEQPSDDAEPPGLELSDLLAGSTGRDETIVLKALGQVPGLSVSANDIKGTGTVLGTEAPEQYVWRQGETALAFVERVDEISLGYRAYETTGGTVVRAKIAGRPRWNDPDHIFTVGLDIFDAGAVRSVSETRQTVRVSGYDYGDGLGPVSYERDESNPFQPITEKHTISFSSPLLESETVGDGLGGISCELFSAYLLAEYNRETVRVTNLETPLDVIVAPGQTILLLALDRLGTGEPLWVQSVEVGVEGPEFSQRLTCIGGGLNEAELAAPPY